MPPGTVPAFVMRFDTGSVAVGYLVLRSETKTIGVLGRLERGLRAKGYAKQPTPSNYRGLRSHDPLFRETNGMNDYAISRTWHRTLSALAAALLVAAQGTAAAPELKKMQTIELKGPAGPFDHMMVDHKRSRLLVANQSNDTLDIVDLKTGKLIKQVPEQKQIHGIAYSPELDRVFVGNGEGVCNVLDGENYTVVKSHRVADADNVHYDPRSHRVYVASEKEIAIIDGKSLDLVGSIKLPGSPKAFSSTPAARAFM
jgi:hypothetical protein